METLFEVIHYAAVEGITISPTYRTDNQGIKWLTITLPEHGQFWFWDDATVMQVL